MIANLSHQSSRVFPPGWIASDIAGHKDCDFVSVVLSSKSQCSFGFPNQTSRCTFQRNSRIHVVHSFSGPNASPASEKSNLSWDKFESHMHANLYRVPSSLFKIGLFLPSNTNLSRGVLTVLVFSLHPDSLVMGGACLKSSSMSKYCPN